MKILVVDLETTGLYPNSDLIVEIGIALVDTDTKEVKLVFDEVIRDDSFDKDRYKNSWVFKNTSLTVEDVLKGKSIENYRKELQALFTQYPMTAFNKRFDVGFLTAAGFTLRDIKCLMLSCKEYSQGKDKLGRIKNPSMEEIFNQFFIKDGNKYKEEHRAAADAMDESKILLHLVELKTAKKMVI